MKATWIACLAALGSATLADAGPLGTPGLGLISAGPLAPLAGRVVDDRDLRRGGFTAERRREEELRRLEPEPERDGPERDFDEDDDDED